MSGEPMIVDEVWISRDDGSGKIYFRLLDSNDRREMGAFVMATFDLAPGNIKLLQGCVVRIDANDELRMGLGGRAVGALDFSNFDKDPASSPNKSAPIEWVGADALQPAVEAYYEELMAYVAFVEGRKATRVS